MFVVNFDFSPYNLLPKFLLINIPVVLTELVTYPLQRLQTQLIKRQTYTRGQLSEIPLILSQMFKVEGFPKCYHGFRYSLDYSITQMTFKFFLFDNLMVTDWADSSKYGLYLSGIIANAIATIASQSAFNYQTIASSLEPNKNNTTESVKQQLIKFTQNKSAFRNGLKYTFPVSVINSIAEIYLITQLQGRFLRKSAPQNQLFNNEGYTRQELIIASIVLSLTSLTNHFVIQRQIELCFDLKSRMKYWKGFVGTYMRNMGKGMILYGIYFEYFDWLIKKQIDGQFEKRQVHNIIPNYNRARQAF